MCALPGAIIDGSADNACQQQDSLRDMRQYTAGPLRMDILYIETEELLAGLCAVIRQTIISVQVQQIDEFTHHVQPPKAMRMECLSRSE